MRVAVVGAGIVGAIGAYELAADGHAFTVFERHAAVASETRFANAGVVAPGRRHAVGRARHAAQGAGAALRPARCG